MGGGPTATATSRYLRAFSARGEAQAFSVTLQREIVRAVLRRFPQLDSDRAASGPSLPGLSFPAASVNEPSWPLPVAVASRARTGS